jgi:single-strand DNA-binding protein
MPNTTQITIVGNLGDDPELRYTPQGNAVASFSVAVAQRKYDRDANKWTDAGTTWYRVNAWRDLAEHIAESLKRGNRVIVSGTIASRAWEDKDGNKRETWEVTADSVGADLAYATVTIRRTTRETVPEPADPWAGTDAAPREPAASQAGPRTETETET